MFYNFFKIAAVFAALVLSAGSVNAQKTGPYFSVHGGASLNEDSTLTASGVSANVGFETGAALMGAIGYQFEGGLRLEGELGYSKNDIDSLSITVGQFTATTTAVSGEVIVTSGMVNGIFDFPVEGKLKPYILGGLGLTKADVKIEGVSSDDTAIGGQLGVGLNYAVGEGVSVGASYRYFATADYNFGGVVADYKSHRFLLGVTFKM